MGTTGILTSGYRIGPYDVGSALVEHEAVTEAAVVQKPDPERGNHLVAFVIPPPGVTPEQDLATDIRPWNTAWGKHEYSKKLGSSIASPRPSPERFDEWNSKLG